MMDANNKTREQLIDELKQLRQQVADQEAANTEQRQVEKDILEFIERAKQEWEVTADSLPQLICLLDEEGHIIRANRTVEQWGLAKVVEVKGQKVPTLLHPNHTDSYLAAFLQESWPGLAEGKYVEQEVEDKILKRHFHIQIRPISKNTGRKSKATDSFAVFIIHDISARKQAERLKNEFLANISQELQTPLTSIIGYSQMMLTDLKDRLPAEVVEDIQAIHESGQQLVSLVDEILDLTEIETGNLKLVYEEFSIGPFLDQIKIKHASLLAKPIDISVDVEPNLPVIKADKMRLNQILDHLVTNAIKFTNKGQINLSAFRQNDWLCFEVKDTGIGIKEDDLRIIFEKFRQVDGSLSRFVKGAGLGLTISRHLIQLHGGTIDVNSQVNQGTTFTVRLPIKR